MNCERSVLGLSQRAISGAVAEGSFLAAWAAAATAAGVRDPPISLADTCFCRDSGKAVAVDVREPVDSCGNCGAFLLVASRGV